VLLYIYLWSHAFLVLYANVGLQAPEKGCIVRSTHTGRLVQYCEHQSAVYLKVSNGDH